MPSDKRQRQREGSRARQEQLQAQRQRQSRRRSLVVFLIIAVVVAGLFAVLARGGGKKKSTDQSTATAKPAKLTPVPAGQSITGDTPCPNPDGSSPRASKFEKAPPMCIDPAKTYKAVFDTSEGRVEVDLDAKATPGTVDNFVVLSRYHYYDGSAIHRTDTSIDILQGGSPSTQDLSDRGPGYSIKDEGAPPRHYTEGDLVMARSQGPDSGGAQFFFVAGPKASALDAQGTYVTFGKVSVGLDVVKKILALHATYPASDPKSQFGGAPRRAVIVRKVEIIES